MPKYYRRKRYTSGARDKYSIETKTLRLTTGDSVVNGLYQQAILVVPPTTVEGMRKVKHLTCTLCPNQTQQTLVYWAVVYIPEGYNANPLSGVGATACYEPSQYLISSGIADPDAGPVRVNTPLSRNLNSGDSIWLVVGTLSPSIGVNGLVRYAITLQ